MQPGILLLSVILLIRSIARPIVETEAPHIPVFPINDESVSDRILVVPHTRHKNPAHLYGSAS